MRDARKKKIARNPIISSALQISSKNLRPCAAQHIGASDSGLERTHTGRMAARELQARRTTDMTISHTIGNCFMGLMAFMALATQAGLFNGAFGAI
jgi:hypothetical protein